MFSIFKTLLLYIKISKNKIEVLHLKTEETFSETPIDKFSSDRFVLTDFVTAEKVLQSIIKKITNNRLFLF